MSQDLNKLEKDKQRLVKLGKQVHKLFQKSDHSNLETLFEDLATIRLENSRWNASLNQESKAEDPYGNQGN